MAKAAKDNDRLRVQWVIIMSYATFQFCYGGVETLPWEAKACLLSIKTLHRAQCEHITRTFFSPFQQGEKKKRQQTRKRNTAAQSAHYNTCERHVHPTQFLFHKPQSQSLALWSMPFPHCHTAFPLPFVKPCLHTLVQSACSSHFGCCRCGTVTHSPSATLSRQLWSFSAMPIAGRLRGSI